MHTNIIADEVFDWNDLYNSVNSYSCDYCSSYSTATPDSRYLISGVLHLKNYPCVEPEYIVCQGDEEGENK